MVHFDGFDVAFIGGDNFLKFLYGTRRSFSTYQELKVVFKCLAERKCFHLKKKENKEKRKNVLYEILLAQNDSGSRMPFPFL